jgi:surface carbohydrate biosynthesis protein
MIHILKRIFHIIFFSKKEFKKPPQNKILIFDEVGSELIKQYFPESNTHILHTREESINLFVIFFNFLKGKISKKDYFNNYILTL